MEEKKKGNDEGKASNPVFDVRSLGLLEGDMRSLFVHDVREEPRELSCR